MRVSVISWLRFLIFQQFNVFKLVSKNRGFQVLLHQSNQGSLQQLSRRDGSGSVLKPLHLFGIIIFKPSCWNRWEGSDWFSAGTTVVGKKLLAGLGKLNLESVVLSSWVPCSSVLEAFGMRLFLVLSLWGGFGWWNSQLWLEGLCPVQVVHISSENSWFCCQLPLSGVGVTPVENVVALGWLFVVAPVTAWPRVAWLREQPQGWTDLCSSHGSVSLQSRVSGMWEAALSGSQVLQTKINIRKETLGRFLQVHPWASFLQWWSLEVFSPVQARDHR